MPSYLDFPEIQQRIIIENDWAFAFPTNIPVVPGHVLISPKRVVLSLEELSKEEVNAILELIGQLKPALKKAFGATGFNIAWNEGKDAGQTVDHFHVHVLPRKKGDTGVWQYDPRKFLYRTGSRETSPEKELQAVAEQIKKAL